MNAKELFACILSSENMQAVVNCEGLPFVEIEEDECRNAYQGLSALNRCMLRRRVTRYAEALASRRTMPGVDDRLRMLDRIKKVIL
jgi:hypothetical protein